MDRVMRDDDAITGGGTPRTEVVIGCGRAQPSVDRDADTIHSGATSTQVGEERVHIGRACVHEAPSLGDKPVADVGDLDGRVGNLRPVGFA
jgi:hypothetical protein